MIKKKDISLDPMDGLNKWLSHSTRYSNQIGEISLLNPCKATQGYFEIYCIDGNLFEDVEHYILLTEAEKRIKELLGDQITFKLGR